MQYVLTEGEQHYWFADRVNRITTFVFVISAISFVVYELTITRRPIVDLRVLTNRSVWTGVVLALAFGGVSLGSTYVLPQFVQSSLGFTPTLSGLLFVFRAIPIALCTPIVVALVGKIEPRLALGAGFVFAGASGIMLYANTTPQSGFWNFVVALGLSGMASAAIFIPLSVAVLGATSREDAPKAGAFVNLAVQLGGSVLIAILDVLLDRRQEFHSTILSGNLTIADPAVQSFLQAGHSVAQLGSLIYAQSSILSYADASLFMGAVAIVSIPLILLMRGRGEHVDLSDIEVGG